MRSATPDAPSTSTSVMPRGTGFITGLLTFGAVGTTLYWLVWFLVDRGILASANTAVYYAYENAFPLADGWFVFTCGLGALALWRRRETALLWLLLAGSASLYLAGIDILFDLENGIYLAPTGDWGSVVVELVINLTTLVGGIAVILFGWHNRRRFEALKKA